MISFRFLLLSLLCTRSIASRPESDEVHIATDGHFIRAKLAADRDGSRDHRRNHHQEAAEESRHKHGFDKSEFSHPRVELPHRRQEVLVHDSPHNQYNSSGVQNHDGGHHEDSQTRIHMSTSMHNETQRYHKVLIGTIMQNEHKENSSNWSWDQHYAIQPGNRNWNDCLPYLLTRVFIIALIIYTFMRNHLAQPFQEINDFVVKQRRQEVSTQPAEREPETISQPKSETQHISEKCRQAGNKDDEDQYQEGRAQPVEERLGKAIEDSLSEVEQWLRSEAEVGNGAAPHYDISTPRGSPERVQKEREEPLLQHYQRRKEPAAANASSSHTSATTSAAFTAPAESQQN